MKSSLIILLNNNKIIIANTLGSTTILSKKYNANVNKLKYVLNDFIFNNSIDPLKINAIIVVCDITNLHIPINKCNNNIGYIQLKPSKQAYTIEKKIIGKKVIKLFNINIGLHQKNDYSDNIKQAISYINKNKISKLAINSYFSTTNPEKENELVKLIKKFSSKKLTILKSNIYKISNYLLKENYLLLNIIYYNTAKALLNMLNDALNSLDINCPLYFFRSNGTLIDKYSFLNTSMSTWLSNYSAKTMGCSYITNNNNCIIISKNNNNILIGNIKNSLPVLPENFSTFSRLKIPNFFPKTINVKNTKNLSSIKYSLNRIIVNNNEFTPIINLTSIKYKQCLLMDKVINIDDCFSLPCIGASTAKYEKEFISVIFNTNKISTDAIKQKLLNNAKEYLKENKIILKNIKYNFKITPIKYMPHNSCYIKVIVNGKIK